MREHHARPNIEQVGEDCKDLQMRYLVKQLIRKVTQTHWSSGSLKSTKVRSIVGTTIIMQLVTTEKPFEIIGGRSFEHCLTIIRKVHMVFARMLYPHHVP